MKKHLKTRAVIEAAYKVVDTNGTEDFDDAVGYLTDAVNQHRRHDNTGNKKELTKHKAAEYFTVDGVEMARCLLCGTETKARGFKRHLASTTCFENFADLLDPEGVMSEDDVEDAFTKKCDELGVVKRKAKTEAEVQTDYTEDSE